MLCPLADGMLILSSSGMPALACKLMACAAAAAGCSLVPFSCPNRDIRLRCAFSCWRTSRTADSLCLPCTTLSCVRTFTVFSFFSFGPHHLQHIIGQSRNPSYTLQQAFHNNRTTAVVLTRLSQRSSICRELLSHTTRSILKSAW